MADITAQVVIGANLDGLQSGMTAAAQSVREASAAIRTELDRLGRAAQQAEATIAAAFAKIRETMGELSGAAGGGAAPLEDAVPATQRATGEMIAAYREFADFVEEKQQEIARAQERLAERAIAQWGAVFDRIGGDFQRSLGDLLFSPPRPETYYSDVIGPGGQVLQQPHQYSELATVGLDLLRSIGKDVTSSITSALSHSLAQSLFGAGVKSFGQGLAQLLGVGTPGGLFGTGIGGVTGAGKEVLLTANTTALGALTTAVAANTVALGGATAASATAASASGAGSALSAAGSAGGILSGIKSIGGFIGGIFGFERGGIVPSAASGWALPSFAGVQPALLHAREMVLPAEISEGLQSMIAAGGPSGGPGGGDAHFHFHGPMDRESLSRWWSDMVRSHPEPVRQLLRGAGFSLA
ncbi:MAG TPA: hypothetical protein VGR91_17295 [Stellaceae bacterium]|nr:hypothetical protein [Stellaceae bacterium]